MKVTLNCLSYDFIGTCVDESTEDVTTVQIPSSWRPLFEDVGCHTHPPFVGEPFLNLHFLGLDEHAAAFLRRVQQHKGPEIRPGAQVSGANGQCEEVALCKDGNTPGVQ